MSNTHVVIMAGGVGSRLYPLSTPERPKQFLDLLRVGKTMLQITVERFLPVAPVENIWVVTSSDYVHYVREQVPGILPDHILAEPCARNTAPCIAYAMTKILKKHPDALVAVTPADAYVPDVDAFTTTIKTALEDAGSSDHIICLGITPSRPAVEYGYIKASSAKSPDVVAKVDSFKEKPSLDLAEEYLKTGEYFWNAGIFVWKAETALDNIRRFAPSIAGVMSSLAPSFYTENEKTELERLFPTCEKISIDYAVMEKSPSVYVIPAVWEWSDLGSFKELERFMQNI
ncbi:MAG: mannose-1-phosphate guanylyltransferase [Bacteroidales bacterium]|nr:mannose-1-phosphate guanylyltransferase [Bacteroidales bacterium]